MRPALASPRPGRDGADGDAETLLRGAARALLVRAGDASSARLEAEILLAHVLGSTRGRLLGLETVEPADRTAFEALVNQRATTACPVAYLTRRAPFWDLELMVDGRVLIPRPETETLVELFEKLDRGNRIPPGVVVDRGTGSGCVALALGGRRTVLATDLSADALVVARFNRDRVSVSGRPWLVQAQGLAALRPASVAAVVTNPPYVDADQFASLPPDVGRHEPRAALVPGEGSARAMFARLLDEALTVLLPGGWLLTEVGLGQASEVAAQARSRGYDELLCARDLAGIRRVVGARNPRGVPPARGA